MAGGAGRVRRAAVVVGSDDDEDEDDEDEDRTRDSGQDASGSEAEEVEWSDGAQVDEGGYDSSFIDDSDDDGDKGMERVARPTPKFRDAPRVPATPTTPALTSTAFKRARDSLTAQAFTEFNQRVFDNQLPSNLTIEWNKRLCTTAGRAWPSRFKPSTDRPVPPERKVADDGWVYDARVELSVKVLDSEEKLRRTLLHELCHVAAWVLDHVAKPPHGPRFWHWAKRATRAFPQLEVTTCHDYTINFKYTYVCTVCGYAFGRHSKSVDVQRQACGACNGGKLRLQVAGGSQVQGQPTSTRKPSAYQEFVKERYGQVKQAGKSHKEVMQALSEMWAKEGKQTGAAGDQSMTAA
ncbi:SprT-like family-domain-containing protein [Catenaria anguillulae PL171]|uniref:SprT-like family-domain-containing protein n=1 Tax=Catenaria anguillulae PL171 TaxID=765915 RepID=A0A1Y2HBU7_9FUNG|nr:SprT-like family-domain-containing protein [Catenaria anguillulae PL171]